jgi:hypothetical protein
MFQVAWNERDEYTLLFTGFSLGQLHTLTHVLPTAMYCILQSAFPWVDKKNAPKDGNTAPKEDKREILSEKKYKKSHDDDSGYHGKKYYEEEKVSGSMIYYYDHRPL